MKLIRYTIYLIWILFLITGLWMPQQYTGLSWLILFIACIFVWSLFKSESERIELEYKKARLKEIKDKNLNK